MADLLVPFGPFVQGTGSPTDYFDQLVSNNQIQSTSQACLVDITPPTFAGIASLTVQSLGQFRASWLAGSDVTMPVRYQVYIKPLTASGLFSSVNLLAITPGLQFDIFTLPDGSVLQGGVTYYVGVRAMDGVGNTETNTNSLSASGAGVSAAVPTYVANGAFVVNAAGNLQGTLWATKDGQLANGSVLGDGRYDVYDKAGTLVAGLSESGISPDGNGMYQITEVAASSLLDESLDHYMVRVGIVVDGAERVEFVPIVNKQPEYDIDGLFYVDESQQFDGSFWVSANEIVKTTGLGTGSYQVYDQTGAPIMGMSGSGIAADVNGVFKITAIASTLGTNYRGYTVKVTVTVDNVQRSELIPVYGRIPTYETHGQFAINASNQFQATLWATVDGIVKTGAALGAANYTVYDAGGIAVAGLTQSGITADANGRFQITPVSAVLLTDLTHYSVKIGIIVDGVERISYKGFTLLGN
jgi:hypothetical protein